MSLRLRRSGRSTRWDWLVAVPLLIAALLSPIVGFNGWQDRRLPGDRADTVRLADAPRHAPARVAAVPERRRAAAGAIAVTPRSHARAGSALRRSAQPGRRTAPRRRPPCGRGGSRGSRHRPQRRRRLQRPAAPAAGPAAAPGRAGSGARQG